MASKIALVTGGSRGLGKDMALSLAKKGMDILITYQSKHAEAEKVVEEISALNQKAMAMHFDTPKKFQKRPGKSRLILHPSHSL